MSSSQIEHTESSADGGWCKIYASQTYRPLSTSSRLLYLLILLALAMSACSSAPRVKDKPFTEAAIEATNPAAQESFSAGVLAADSANWQEAEKAFDQVIASEGDPASSSSMAAQVLKARTALGSLEWLVDGTQPAVALSDPAVQEAFASLRRIVETPNVDARVHYAARLYLAAIYLMDHQADEAFHLLSDYPSNAMSALILDKDRFPLRFLLAASFSKNGRHLESSFAYETTLKEHREMESRRAIEGNEGQVDLPKRESLLGDLFLNLLSEEVASLSDEELQEAIAQGDWPRVRALAVLEVVRKQVENGGGDEAQNRSILQTLTDFEPEVRALGKGAEVERLKRQLTDKKEVTAVRNIGVLLPLSGPNRPYGLRAQEAIMVASSGFDSEVTDTNLKTRFIFEDSTQDPAAIVEKFNKNNVLAVIGPLTPDRTSAYAPLLAARKIPLLSLAATLPKGTNNPYLFRFYLDALEEARAMAAVAVKKLGDLRAVVLFSPNGYGRAMSTAFQDVYRRLGGEVVLTLSIDPKSTNFTDLATKVDGANPQTIFIAARPEKVAEVSAFLAQQNIWGTSTRNRARSDRNGRKFIHYLGTSTWQDGALLQQSYSYLEGALIPAWSSPMYDNGVLGQRIQSQFLSATGRVPDTFKVVAGDAALLAHEYTTRRGVESGERFREELLQGAAFGGNAGRVKFRADGSVDRGLRLLEVKGGQVSVSPMLPVADVEGANGS